MWRQATDSPPGLMGVPLAWVVEATAGPRVPKRTRGRWEAGDRSDPACPSDKRWNVLRNLKLDRGHKAPPGMATSTPALRQGAW